MKAVSLINLDQVNDGISGLLIGWESGRLEVSLKKFLYKLKLNRSEVIFQEKVFSN